MRFGFVLGEMGQSIRRNLLMSFSLVLVTAVSLTLFGAGLLAQKQVGVMTGYWYNKVQLTMFLCGQDADPATCPDGAATPAERDQIIATLNGPQLKPYVEQFWFESKQEAYTHFKAQSADSALTDNVTVDQMPESFRVRLSDPSQFAVVADMVRALPGVADVPDQNAVLDRLVSLFDVATYVAWGTAGFALAASVLLVAVTVRLAAFTRRRETGIMRLVGASNLVIQLPFVLEAVLAAVVGAGLASLALFAVVKLVVLDRVAGLLTFIQYIDLRAVWQVVPWLFLVGLLIAASSSFLALRRYLRV